MIDLQHLIYFEHLLEEANNDLVKEATADGELALGYNCYYMPEALLNLPGCFSVRLRAPQSGSTQIGNYYLTQRNCPYTRAILERAIEGGYNFLTAVFGAEACSAMERMEEHFELLHPVQHEGFVTTIIDAPLKDDEAAMDYYEVELRDKVLAPLEEKGIDVSDQAIRQAVDLHNEVSDVITQIGNFRKLPNPPITGYEFHVIQLVSQVCPQKRILPYLKETLEELKTRKPEKEFPFRARVVLAGSEIDDPKFTQLIESCGAMVVADRYCFGSVPSREQIEIRDGETALRAIVRHYIETSLCPRFMTGSKIDQRQDVLENLVKEYHADGIIYESMKFCEFWSYEKVLSNYILGTERNIPTCIIEKEYALTGIGQLQTRFQAFVEGLEIKKHSAARVGKQV